MDVIEVSALVTLFVGVTVGVQHMYDRYAPNGLYRRTERRASSIGTEIGSAVEGALTRVAAQQTALAEEAEKALGESMKMGVVRSVGVDKQMQAQASALIAEGMLQNVLPILRMIVPGIADQLEENPQLIFTLIENPYFKKYVLPRIQAYLPSDSASVGSAGVSSGSGWGP